MGTVDTNGRARLHRPIRPAGEGLRNLQVSFNDVCKLTSSPNEIELQAILESATSDAEVNAKRFHDLCAASSGDIPAIVVRSGPRGAYTLSSQWSGWVPAYWRPEEPSHIVDVTGGGNSFLGGLLAGLLLTNDYRAGE